MWAAAGLMSAALLAGSMGSATPAQDTILQFPSDATEDFQALPRVGLETPQARAINAALDRIDTRDRENRAMCLEAKTENDNVQWGRSVEAPMMGPRFVSLVVSQGEYCGGAHPNWARYPLVFDLETGRLIDWRGVLPANMIVALNDQDADRWVRAAYLQSPRLKAWFAERALAGMDPRSREDCGYLYGEDEHNSWGLEIWPDAKAGGLTLQTAGLAHAETGCLAEVVMSLDEMRRQGVRPDLIEAIDTAHRAHLWRDAPSEPDTAR